MTEEERIKSIQSNGGDHLKTFKKENITYNMCLAAVKCNGDAIYYVPEQYLSEEICTEACKNCGAALMNIPEEYITREMCEAAIEEDGTMLKCVPEKFLNEELCFKAVLSSAQAYSFVPKKYITPEFVANVAHKSNYFSVSSLPEAFKKGPFYYDLIILDPEFIWYIPKKALTAKICKTAIKGMGYNNTAEAVKDKPKLLCRLHTSLYDHDSCIAFVNSKYFSDSCTMDHHNIRSYGFRTVEDKEAGRFYLAEKYNETYSLPHMMKWSDVAINFLKLDGKYLSYCPDEIITEEMCKIAITSNSHSFAFFPEKYKTKEMCYYAFEQDPKLISKIPEKYISLELALKAVKYSGFLLKYIPMTYRTKEVCLIAVSDEGKGEIENVPASILDKDIILAYLDNVSFLCSHELKKIPQEKWDYDICLAAVKKDGYDLQYVPTDLIDENICLQAVKRSPGAAKYIPEKIFTVEMALATVEISYDFKYIPRSCITKEVCMKALSHGDYFAGTILNEIPQELITQEMCNLAVEISPHSLKAVPEKYVTEYILQTVAKRACALVLRNFPERLRTRNFIRKLIETNPDIEQYVSKITPID